MDISPAGSRARRRRNPQGLAWTLEPGSDLMLQFHPPAHGKAGIVPAGNWLYTSPIMRRPTVPSELGLVDYGFEIPAGATNVTARDESCSPPMPTCSGCSHTITSAIGSKAVPCDRTELRNRC